MSFVPGKNVFATTVFAKLFSITSGAKIVKRLTLSTWKNILFFYFRNYQFRKNK